MSRKIITDLRDGRFANLEEVNAALELLGDISRADAGRALDAFLERTLDGDIDSLRAAYFVGVVRRCGDRALFPLLARALVRTPHPNAREAISRALRSVNNVAEHGVLLGLLRHADASTRTAALRTLEKVAVAATFDAFLDELRRGAAWPGLTSTLVQLVRGFGARATRLLLGAIESPDPRLSVAGFEAAAQVVGVEGVDHRALLSLAHARLRPSPRSDGKASTWSDLNVDVAAAALACAAVCAQDAETYLALTAGVREAGPVRLVQAALRGLARFATSPHDDGASGTPVAAVYAALEARLVRGPESVSMVALQVLQQIGTDDAVPPIVAGLGARRLAVRGEAVRVMKALAESGKIDMARAVVRLLRSRNPDVRRMASEVLSSLRTRDNDAPWHRMLQFVQDEDWWVRERLADVLVPAVGPALIPHLIPLLSSSNAGVRRYGCATLGRIQDASVLGALLVQARDDVDWLVREEAVHAIASLGDARAVPYLVKLLELGGTEVAVLGALSRLRSTDALALAAKLLRHPVRDVRLAVLHHLGSVDARELAPAVTQSLADPDADVAARAGGLLRSWQAAGDTDPVLDEAEEVLATLLRAVVRAQGSDLLLVAGQPAFLKRDGRVERLTSRDLSAENVYELLAPLLSPAQVALLTDRHDVDFSHENRRVRARFRVNAFQSESGLGAVFRIVKNEVRSLSTLGVPPIVETFADLPSGLVLLGGPPGAGKSTTLAGIVDAINRGGARHIVTLEDPIEGVHAPVRSIVTQREIGSHTDSYSAALRAALRQDPDVILVGELRDLETIQFAVTAAETGHLVFGTVHAVAADSCVERLINAFPADRHPQVRTVLSEVLRAVVCQQLIPAVNGERRLVCEVMVNSEAVAHHIRKGQPHQIASTMALSREQGMILFDDALQALVDRGLVHVGDAHVKARDKSRFPVPDAAPLASPVAGLQQRAAPAPRPPPSTAPMAASTTSSAAFSAAFSPGSSAAEARAAETAPQPLALSASALVPIVQAADVTTAMATVPRPVTVSSHERGVDPSPSEIARVLADTDDVDVSEVGDGAADLDADVFDAATVQAATFVPHGEDTSPSGEVP